MLARSWWHSVASASTHGKTRISVCPKTLHHSPGTGVSVVAVDPSLTDTNITRHMSMMKSVSRFFVYPIFWPFMKSAKIGGQVILHAALDPEVEGASGDYYV